MRISIEETVINYSENEMIESEIIIDSKNEDPCHEIIMTSPSKVFHQHYLEKSLAERGSLGNYQSYVEVEIKSK